MAEGHIAPFPTYEPELLGQRVVVIDGSAAIGFETARPARASDQITDITTTVAHVNSDRRLGRLAAPRGPLVLHSDTAHDEG